MGPRGKSSGKAGWHGFCVAVYGWPRVRAPVHRDQEPTDGIAEQWRIQGHELERGQHEPRRAKPDTRRRCEALGRPRARLQKFSRQPARAWEIGPRVAKFVLRAVRLGRRSPQFWARHVYGGIKEARI